MLHLLFRILALSHSANRRLRFPAPISPPQCLLERKRSASGRAVCQVQLDPPCYREYFGLWRMRHSISETLALSDVRVGLPSANQQIQFLGSFGNSLLEAIRQTSLSRRG